MIVISRRKNEVILVGNTVVTVNQIIGGRVKLGIEAPKEIVVLRGELTGRPKYKPLREAGGEDAEAA